MFSAKYTYYTRQAQQDFVKHTQYLDLGIIEDSFIWRASKGYDGLPIEIRRVKTIGNFKKECKTPAPSRI